MHDLESDSAFRSAEIHLYDDGSLVYNQDVTWSDNGNNTSHSLGIVAEGTSQYFDQVVIAVGDDGSGRGLREFWAADEFTFGQAYEVPFEFNSWPGLLLVGSIWGLNKLRQQLLASGE